MWVNEPLSNASLVAFQRVNFAEQMQQTHFYEQTEPAAPANDLDMKELQIVPYMDSASAGYKAFDSSSDLVNINSTEPHMTRPENSNQVISFSSLIRSSCWPIFSFLSNKWLNHNWIHVIMEIYCIDWN